MKMKNLSDTRIALRTALIYAAVGFAWIILTDRLVEIRVEDPALVFMLSVGKGWFYVGATAWLLFALIRRDLKAVHESERALDAHKRDFYRRTIMAATDGKLIISDKIEIEKVAGPAIASWKIESAEGLSKIRNEAAKIIEQEGLGDDRLFDFILGIGEASTNAFKHAGGGTVSMHRVPGGIFCVISDNGPGIEALVLPEVALVRGYTTAESLGMGYKAMITIADKIYLATGTDGTTVGIEMLLSPERKPAIPFACV